ncbi:MAG TPA: hypothetical protein VLF89_02615 [Candidatus Saccharimonadales bacterium]|nr:hypothetical protein [Candidatus Saccharimonadales bacterium]
MNTNTSIFHSFADDKNASLFSPALVVILSVFIILGIGTGYLLAQRTEITPANSQSGAVDSVSVGTSYGSTDTATFKDMVEGVVQKGGIQDEGQYHLVRPGGDSQNVYLTSSLVDLSQFIGHKVKIWGQTQKAQYAGWLMDVGKVEVEQ